MSHAPNNPSAPSVERTPKPAAPVGALALGTGSVLCNADGNIPLPQFRFIAFNEHRSRRRVAAARVEIIPSILHQDDDPPFWVWMTKRDVELNIRDFGQHPELLKALHHFAPNAKAEGAAEAPAAKQSP